MANGSITIDGVTYTAKQLAAMTPSARAILEQLSSTSTTTSSGILLPNEQILKNALQSSGMAPEKAQALAKQYALKPLDIPSTGLNGSSLSLTDGLKSALASLPPEIGKVVENRLGFNDTRLGKTLDERIAAALPVLQAAKGHIGNIDLNLALANSTVTTLQKELSNYAAALSSGNQAALIGATASAKYTAEADADSTLTNWGLDTPEMNSLVNKMVANGVTNQNEILQNIRQSQTYKTAFSGLAEYNSVPGHVHMTENEYRTYSQAVLGAAQQYGQVSLNQQQIGQLLKGNVSASEFQQRVQDIGSAIANANAGTKQILEQQFGINPSHLFAYYANPKEALPDMQRAVASGEIQDYANRVGLGGLRPSGANQLADMAKLAATQGNNNLAYGVGQIEGSLLNASRDSALTASQPGAGTPTINTNTLIGSQLAGFGGNSQVADQIAVGRAEGARAAPFDKGGGFEQSSKGVDVGSSPT